jgi:hypothetical protein
MGRKAGGFRFAMAGEPTGPARRFANEVKPGDLKGPVLSMREIVYNTFVGKNQMTFRSVGQSAQPEGLLFSSA